MRIEDLGNISAAMREANVDEVDLDANGNVTRVRRGPDLPPPPDMNSQHENPKPSAPVIPRRVTGALVPRADRNG